jgi:hypothetical protein
MNSAVRAAPVTFSRHGDWLVATRPVGESPPMTAEERLRGGAALRGNLRYVQTRDATVIVADAYVEDADQAVERAVQRLSNWFEGTNTVRPDVELIDALLAERELKFERLNEAWILAGGLAGDLTIRREKGGLRVESLLGAFDTPSRTTSAALGEFLASVQQELRFVRLELRGASALAVAWCERDALACELDHALAGVRWTCQQLIPAVKALAHAPLARCYLEFVVNSAADHAAYAHAAGEPADPNVFSNR